MRGEKKQALRSFINLGLLLPAASMVFSGFLIQIAYHMGHHGVIDTTHFVLGLNYFTWSDIHKVSIVLLSIGTVFHIIRHRKWYKTVLKKKALLLKNHQVVILTIVFILAAVTGYFSWFITLSGGSEANSKLFIEIHDKITLVLTVYLFLHVAKKFKRLWTPVRRTRRNGDNLIDRGAKAIYVRKPD